MGMFSWLTADTKEVVKVHHSSVSYHAKTHGIEGQRPVYMLQPNGLEPIRENAYSGYGICGGLDVFAWLAKTNLPNETAKLDLFEDERELRQLGIDLCWDDEGEEIFPQYPLKFSYNPKARYEDLSPSESCGPNGEQ